MNLLYRSLALAGLSFLVATATLAQDGTELIDDLPNQRKEAAGENPRPAKKVKRARPQNDGDKPAQPGRPNVDLIDDLSPEQKEAAERNAARKNENAIPDNLADALARALHNSPSILVADAKVRQSQAELNEVRLSVVQELTLAFQRRTSNKAALAHHLAAVKTGQETPQTSANVQQAIMEDETKILYLLGIGAEHAVEAPHGSAGVQSKHGAGGGMMMPGMMGTANGMMGPMGGGMMGGGMLPGMAGGMGPMGGGMGAGMGMRMGGGRAKKGQGTSSTLDSKEASELPENVQTFLDKRVDVDFSQTQLADVLEYLRTAAGTDVAVIIESPEEWKPNPEGGDAEGNAVTLSLKHVTVRSALQALADLHHCAFVFRDYGILVLGPDVEVMDTFNSLRAAGTQMIAPPSAVPPGGGPGMGAF